MNATNQLLENFLLAAVNSGLKIELTGPCSTLYVLGDGTRIPSLDTTTYSGQLGIKLSRNANTWHWFKYWIGAECFVSFEHSYSQRTGKTIGKRGYSYRQKIKSQVCKALGVSPNLF